MVWYDESVQINIYLDPSKTYFQMTTYNPDVRLDVIYPVVYIHMYAGLTEANADQVKGTSRSIITRTSARLPTNAYTDVAPCSYFRFAVPRIQGGGDYLLGAGGPGRLFVAALPAQFFCPPPVPQGRSVRSRSIPLYSQMASLVLTRCGIAGGVAAEGAISSSREQATETWPTIRSSTTPTSKSQSTDEREREKVTAAAFVFELNKTEKRKRVAWWRVTCGKRTMQMGQSQT